MAGLDPVSRVVNTKKDTNSSELHPRLCLYGYLTHNTRLIHATEA